MSETRETDNMAKGQTMVPTWWACHLEQQRNLARFENVMLKRERNNMLLELGAIQSTIATTLNLDYTPQTAEQIQKEIERFVGYKRLMDITNEQL